MSTKVRAELTTGKWIKVRNRKECEYLGQNKEGPEQRILPVSLQVAILVLQAWRVCGWTGRLIGYRKAAIGQQPVLPVCSYALSTCGAHAWSKGPVPVPLPLSTPILVLVLLPLPSHLPLNSTLLVPLPLSRPSFSLTHCITQANSRALGNIRSLPQTLLIYTKHQFFLFQDIQGVAPRCLQYKNILQHYIATQLGKRVLELRSCRYPCFGL